jgi:hypothetical protein
MNTGSTGEPPKTATYLLLCAVQMFGADFVVWDGLPAFKQLALNPGEQLVNTRYDGFEIVAVLCLMQILVSIPARCNSLPGTKAVLESRLSVSGPPEFYFRKRAFLNRTLPTPSGTQFRRRHLPFRATRSSAHLFPVRTVLLLTRARAAGSGAWE